MKKINLLFVFISIALLSFSQTAVNKDGSIKFRGNVAILVKSRYYTFQNGNAVKCVDDESKTFLETTLRAISMEKFQNICFGIVNRDDIASKQVEELIEENKLEDYLDGISVRAKNQGADYLYLVEAVIYGEDDASAQIEISSRLMNVENNLGYHSYYRSKAVALNNEEQMRKDISKLVKTFSLSLENTLMQIFPEQYYITKAEGKNWYLGAYQPNGRIMPTDRFYAFNFQKENMNIAQDVAPIQVLDNIAVCQNASLSNGQLVVKSNTQVQNTSNIVLFRNVPQPIFQGANQMTMTFFGLNNDNESYDGLTKGRINNAVFDAITRHPGLQLIEHDHLPSLKKERELQKSEDFLDGHVVKQMKAIGATYLLKLENYVRNERKVSFKMSFISVGQNMIVRTIDVVTSIDNIEDEMYKQICERIAYPCVVKKIAKNKYELSSAISLQTGNDCILAMTKAIQNPMTGETSYNRTDVCSAKLEKYMGNKCIVSIDKVFSADDLSSLEQISQTGLVTLRIDGTKIRSDIDYKTDVQRQINKQEKRKKVKETLRGIGKSLFGNAKISINGN